MPRPRTDLTRPLSAGGSALDASFRVDLDSDGVSLYFASRGGTAGSSAVRNTQYAAGLALLLERLRAINAVIEDAILDSNPARHATRDARRLPIKSPFALPIQVGFIDDVDRLRRAIQYAQRRVLSASGEHKTSGNDNRAIRLFLAISRADLAGPGRLQEYLVTGALPSGYPAPEEADEESSPATGSYVPTGEDTRERARRSILLRRGQSAFRRALLETCGRRCCVTGCDLEDLLEAAHIDPYRGDHTNRPDNGLLLRADIHTLFDLDLLGIEAVSGVIHLHPSVRAAGYSALEGLRVNYNPSMPPSAAALARRWGLFQARLAPEPGSATGAAEARVKHGARGVGISRGSGSY